MTGGVVGLGPVAQQDREVVERTPSRAHVPIDHRDRGETFGVEDHVVELEVVVHEGHRAFGLDVRLQPRDDAPDRITRLPVTGKMRALRPARDLAGEEPLGAAEGVEADGPRTRPGAGRPARPRRSPAIRAAWPARPARAGGSSAPMTIPGRYSMRKKGAPRTESSSHRWNARGARGEFAPEPREHPVLANHVVGAGGKGPGGGRRRTQGVPSTSRR